MGKITSCRILLKCKRNKRMLIWRHAWRWFPKNSYTKLTTKVVLFSILQHNLSNFITQTGLYCSKQLETTFSSILWKTVAYHLQWLSLSVLNDVIVALHSLSMTAEFLISLGLWLLLTLAKTACAHKMANFTAPFTNKSSAAAEMGDCLATLDMGRKVRAAVPLSMRGGAGSLSNTMLPLQRPTSIPSGILSHPAIWLQ